MRRSDNHARSPMPKWYRELLTQEADPDLRAEIGHYLESRRPRSRKLDAGCVVEFMKKDRLCCGAVWPHAANGRMQFIVDADASQTWVRRSRLLDISSVKVSVRGRRQAAAALDLIDERRRRQAAQLDMETVWALAAESKAATGWTTEFLTDLAFGDHRGGDSRAVLLRVLYAGDWFCRRGDRWVTRGAPAVDRRRQLARNRQRQSGELDIWPHGCVRWPMARPSGAHPRDTSKPSPCSRKRHWERPKVNPQPGQRHS